jgi:hypothetical protein
MGMRGVAEAKKLANEAGSGKGVVVNTTSKAKANWETDLSPFSLGPCPLYGGYTATNVENAWQYCKVYKQHLDSQGNLTEDYWAWARNGWSDSTPRRYPMGRGAKPEYSLWKGQKLGYIDARKQIYAPLFAEAVLKTKGWQKLLGLYETREIVVLRDYDGYRHDLTLRPMSLSDVLNCPNKIMGHAFVLKMLLTKDEALNQIDHSRFMAAL